MPPTQNSRHTVGQAHGLSPRILGIETSCDETAAAVVEAGTVVLSSVVASQLDTHGRYGGVVPELASREHLRAIVPVVRLALEQAATDYQDLSAVAVTAGPGLVGSLLVGITYGKALCLARQLPLIGVNHIEGHIHAVISQAKQSGSPVEYPALALVVSGGHTHLFEVEEGFRYRLLGKTRDDAAGEAFDKVAKLLGFSYPGGPVIDRLAPHGDPGAIRFTLARMKGNPLDFSFSGLKTAVLRWVEQRDLAGEIEARRELLRRQPRPSLDQWLEVTPKATLDLLASFQRTVITELLRRAAASAEDIQARSLIIAGGVACNSGLRSAAESAQLPCLVHFPAPALATDNAAMIAAAAFPKFERGEFADLSLRAQAGLTLA
jgi:N6-L-threonylcarbamoyladenine synthase